ncbi:nuclear receptor coactivator 5-like isoform X2 [Hyla sarda]|uniref:nuclear receptor coactivator 5-like isoform X2 n=1 Tax=Hyla sarda TaxID=327740 RepID=UPI0024C2B590|nr:nuclear receptor coactivator 5-like isoform X2 [Hyla sarda]
MVCDLYLWCLMKWKPSWIPRLLDINPYKPSQKASFSEQYTRDLEEENSFEELFGKKYNFTSGNEEYCERYQYSQNSTQYNSDDRREKLYMKFYQQIQDEYHKERPSDCVIVAISKDQMEYATAIGHRLQDHGLVVEMIYLTSESGLTRALQEVKNDGSPFCILVEQSNVALSSCTAIILHESIKRSNGHLTLEVEGCLQFFRVHRNMPMEDALALIVKAFGKIFGEREQQERNEISHKAADLADDYLERQLYQSYNVPLDIRHLLFLLSDGKYLYSEELNAISDYLKTRITELEGYEEADTTEQANSHSSTKTHLLEKPPPLLPTPARNSYIAQPKPSLLGDRPSGGGLLPTPGFNTTDQTEDGVSAVYEANIPAIGSDALAKPPPLLPTPGRTPLMAIGKPSLLRDRPSAGLLPTPGLSAAKGKPPPLLAMPPKRPPLLGFPPHSPAKRPLLGDKPGLLPTPPVSVNTTSLLWPSKPKPLLK